MRDNNVPRHEPIGVSRNVIKTTPTRVTALWLFAIFVIASAAYIGTWLGAFLYGGFIDLAYFFGLAFTVGICSVLGYLTIVIQENAQDIKVKIIREG